MCDGSNPKGSTAWLWVAVTPLVSFFQILLSRSQEAAQTILGQGFAGILVSDRHGGYNWVDLERRQLCWAHLRRDFIQISERSGGEQREKVSSGSLGGVTLSRSRALVILQAQKEVGFPHREVLLAQMPS